MRNTACSPHCGIPSLRTTRPARPFYHKVIDSLDMGDSSYLLLLACDSYDVPHRARMIPCKRMPRMRCSPTSSVWCAPSRRARWNWDTSPVTMNSTVLPGKPSLLLSWVFCSRHSMTGQQISITLSFTAGRPMKFTRSSLTRSSMWKRRCLPLSRRKHSESALSDAFDCSLEVMQTVHEQLREKIKEHRESREFGTSGDECLRNRANPSKLRDCG